MSRAVAYPFLFLDADWTLFDFQKSEGEALRLAFEEKGFAYDEGVRTRYHEINSALWRGFERGQVDKADLQRVRFATLLSEFGHLADPLAFNARYLHLLAENVHLIDGAVEVCADLARRATLLLATNGISWTQRRRLANSALAPFFRFVVTSEDAGAQKPEAGFFAYALSQCGDPDPSRVLMVGDQLNTDILGGERAGLATCWYNPRGEARPEGAPRIDHEIRRLEELPGLLGPGG